MSAIFSRQFTGATLRPWIRLALGWMVLAKLGTTAQAREPVDYAVDGHWDQAPAFGLSLTALDAPFEARCTANGLTVFMRQVPGEAVAVHLVEGVGESDSPDTLPGAGHLLEHLWYRSRPGGGEPVEARLEASGATFNASTWPDHTIYHAVAPMVSWTTLLDLEAGRAVDMLAGVQAADLESERRIIAAELHTVQRKRVLPIYTLTQNLFSGTPRYQQLARVSPLR